MKTINPDVARQLSINFFIANLPILMLTGLVVASLVGLTFRSSVLFWLALLITPLSINYLYSKKTHKTVLQRQQMLRYFLSCQAN